MKQEIISLLEESLPLVDFNSDFLFAELTSLDIVHILFVLSEKYNVKLTAKDVTPKNFRNVDSIVAMVESKRS